MWLLLQINNCFINEGKCAGVHLGREVILPRQARFLGMFLSDTGPAHLYASPWPVLQIYPLLVLL